MNSEFSQSIREINININKNSNQNSEQKRTGRRLEHSKNDIINKYYQTKVEEVVPDRESNRVAEASVKIIELIESLPQTFKKLDFLFQQFRKTVVARNDPKSILNLLDDTYRKFGKILDDYNNHHKIQYSAKRGEPSKIGFGLGNKNQEFKLKVEELNKLVNNYYLQQPEIIESFQNFGQENSRHPYGYDFYKIYSRLLDMGDDLHSKEFQSVIEEFPYMIQSNLPKVVLFGSLKQAELATEMLKKQSDDGSNVHSFARDINSLVFLQAIYNNSEYNQKVVNLFAELMGEEKSVASEYIYRWNLSHSFSSYKYDSLIGDNLVKFIELKKENPELCGQLRTDLNIYCLERYNNDYLKSLPEKLSQNKPYVLTVVATEDGSGVIGIVYKPISIMEEQLGENGNVIAMEAESFVAVSAWLKKRYEDGFNLPDVVYIVGHGSHEVLVLNSRGKFGFLESQQMSGQPSKLPVYLEWLKKLNITVVLDACSTGSTDSNSLHSKAIEHNLKVIAPQSDVSGRGTEIKLNLKDGHLQVSEVNYPDSETSYPPH